MVGEDNRVPMALLLKFSLLQLFLDCTRIYVTVVPGKIDPIISHSIFMLLLNVRSMKEEGNCRMRRTRRIEPVQAGPVRASMLGLH